MTKYGIKGEVDPTAKQRERRGARRAAFGVEGVRRVWHVWHVRRVRREACAACAAGAAGRSPLHLPPSAPVTPEAAVCVPVLGTSSSLPMGGRRRSSALRSHCRVALASSPLLGS